MYIPAQFAEANPEVLRALIRTHPLGAWVTPTDPELLVNHLPFLLDSTRGERGVLMGHVARANPVWQQFSRIRPSVVIFQGPQQYITPSWYPSKAEHGKMVPTWNYAVVHVHGIPQLREDRDWLLNHVTQLSAEHESREATPWRVDEAPAEFIEGLLRAIVGVEIPIERWEGKWKVSQNRTPADQAGVVTGLRTRGTEDAEAMARLVERGKLRAES